jgi:large subunit ribosomal protein L24
MASKKSARRGGEKRINVASKSSLKKGDVVMVISGGNRHKRPIQGRVGRILSFAGERRDRVVVEGLNLFTRHKKQSAPGKSSGKIQKEGSIHISNVMYYVEKIKKPVRLCHRFLEDGTKVRGYVDPTSKEFVQI